MTRLTRRHLFRCAGAIGTAATGLFLMQACALNAPGPAVKSVPRVGLLFTSLRANPHFYEAFRQGMRELGWVEGRTIAYEPRSAEGLSDTFPVLVDDLLQHGVDVIVVSSSPSALASKQATSTVPIVMAGVADPVELGLVISLTRPGSNVTGLGRPAQQLSSKRLEFLRDFLPGLSRVGVLVNPATASATLTFAQTESAARLMGLRVSRLEIRSDTDLDGAFQAARNEAVDAVVVLPDTLFNANRSRIAYLAEAARLPAIYPVREYVADGGMVSYGESLADLHRRAAGYVNRILHGSNPGDLPIEQPNAFEVVVNATTAQVLGVSVPPEVAAQVTEWIQ